MKKIALLLSLFLSFSNTSFAQSYFLDFNFDEILGPYPPIGSLEEKLDIAQVLYLQKIRTHAECVAAGLEEDASLRAFFGGEKGLLSSSEINKIQGSLILVTLKTGAEILINKSKFKRPRPYLTYPAIKPCIQLESSKAYPSGHATLVRMYARVLAEIFPERRIQLLSRADEVAFNRILEGVHHPSDIVAGKKLGDAIAEEYLKNVDFYPLLKGIDNIKYENDESHL